MGDITTETAAGFEEVNAMVVSQFEFPKNETPETLHLAPFRAMLDGKHGSGSMAHGSREEVAYERRCPKCGKSGIVTYEENEGPRGTDAASYVYRSPVRTVEPFHLSRGKVICECGQEITNA